jgi:alcohol dehydrogenase (cytochrome c)
MRRIMKIRGILTVSVLAGMVTGCSQPGNGGSAAPGPGANWPSYNGNLTSQRYSSLSDITPQNASQLKPVCHTALKEIGPLQATPIAIDGTLYVTTARDTYALNGTDCKLKWENDYTPKDPEPFPNNRGVAISRNTLVRGESDGHLIAIDVATGKTLWDVAPASGARGEFLSSAPVIWNNTAYIGTAGSDWGVKGRMMAFDIKDGRQKWSFTTVASGNDPNAGSWGGVRAQETGGGGMWTSYTLDPQTGEIFVPVANPAPDFASGYRPGSNLYTDSIVVLDARTGKLKWYWQSIPHDVHDWDMSTAPVLITDKRKQIVATSSKDGFIYGLDRATHKLIYKTAEVRTVNFDKQPTSAGVRICPGVLGGSEWNGPAFDQRDNLLITPMDDWCATLKLGATRYVPGQFFFGGSYAQDDISSARGTLTATDAESGKITWQYKSQSPMLAGVTPTATGVTFTGDMAGNILAFNSSNGKLLFKNKTQGSIAGGVITYAANGKQYIAATSGNISRLTWGVQGKPSIVIYSL